MAAKPFAFASGRAITQMDSRDATEWRRSRFCYAEFTRLAAAVNELASFTDGDSRDTEMDSRAKVFPLQNSQELPELL